MRCYKNQCQKMEVVKDTMLLSTEGEIILYKPQEDTRIQVRLVDDTVWLSQQQMVSLFKSSKANISEHIKSIFHQGELDGEATVRFFRTVRIEGERTISRKMAYYNLDVIISVGYRVNTKRGILFRQWANQVLKEYLLKGYSINNRVSRLEKRVSKTEGQIDFFIKSSLPPVQGIFFDGQIFDAYNLISNFIRKAKREIILIDNYIDDSVLKILDKRGKNVSATVYTAHFSEKLQLDLAKHNSQYSPINIKTLKKFHDRFLIIDDDVYHIGASIKDLGKSVFAFSKMGLEKEIVLSIL